MLDLRGIRLDGTSVHHAVLLADSLLAGGVIGRVHTAQREMTIRPTRCTLPGWPMAVLCRRNDERNRRSGLRPPSRTITGRSSSVRRPTRDGGTQTDAGDEVRSSVTVGDGSWSIDLATG